MSSNKVVDLLLSHGVLVLELVKRSKLVHVQAIWGDDICNREINTVNAIAATQLKYINAATKHVKFPNATDLAFSSVDVQPRDR